MSIEQIETGSINEPTNRTYPPEQFRVVSWNIERGCRLDAVAQFLRAADADLILLQEVDKNCRRTGNRNIARELSGRLQMNYVYSVEFLELTQGSKRSPAYHGQATLSPWPLQRPRVLRFRDQSKFWNPRWWVPKLPPFQRRVGGRMALVTELCLGSMLLTVYNVHLESRNGDDLRVSQLRELLEDAGQHECPVIVSGDFNFDVAQAPQSVAIADAKFYNPFLGQSRPTVVKSNERALSIDVILTRGVSPALDAKVHSDVTASDHYPLTLTLLLDATSSTS